MKRLWINDVYWAIKTALLFHLCNEIRVCLLLEKLRDSQKQKIIYKDVIYKSITIMIKER